MRGKKATMRNFGSKTRKKEIERESGKVKVGKRKKKLV
jgi:hypothetical protein